jgi:hypothetical protein
MAWLTLRTPSSLTGAIERVDRAGHWRTYDQAAIDWQAQVDRLVHRIR